METGVHCGSHCACAPIAIFDSGAGGLSVLREVKKQLPFENFLYFGDAANAPYGEREDTQVLSLVLLHAEHLLREAKALVIACNTATAVAIETLRRIYLNTPIIGTEPAVHPACATGAHPRILVLATEVTLRSGKFEALERAHPAATVVALPAPRMVRLVEMGLADSPQMDAYLRTVLAPFCGMRFDAVVLGCTHFPFAMAALRRAFPYPVPFFDSAKGVASRLTQTLAQENLLSPKKTQGTVTLTASKAEALPLYRALFFEKY